MRRGFLLGGKNPTSDLSHVAHLLPLRQWNPSKVPVIPFSLMELPHEVVCDILEFAIAPNESRPRFKVCEWRDLRALRLTCRFFNSELSREELWKRFDTQFILYRPICEETNPEASVRTKVLECYRASSLYRSLELRNGSCRLSLIGQTSDCLLFRSDRYEGGWCQMVDPRKEYPELHKDLKKVVAIAVENENAALLTLSGYLAILTPEQTRVHKLPISGRPYGLYLNEFSGYAWSYPTGGKSQVFTWSFLLSPTNETIITTPTEITKLGDMGVMEIKPDPENEEYTGDDPANNRYMLFKGSTTARLSFSQVAGLCISNSFTHEEFQRLATAMGLEISHT